MRKLTWYWKLGRIVYAVYPFVLVGALIFVGAFFFNFTTERMWSDIGYENVITLHPNQTYMYNVTISHEIHGPGIGNGERWENGSFVIEVPPLTSTLTSWRRAWVPFMIELKGTGDTIVEMNRTLVGPTGIIEPETHNRLSVDRAIGAGSPEVTQGGTYRLSLQNMDSEDIQLDLSWQLDWHQYEKPYFCYGTAGLLIALIFPAMFLVSKSGPWKHRRQGT